MFSSPPSTPSPSASRSPSPSTSPPPSFHTPVAPGSTPADAVFEYSSRPLVPITITAPQVVSPRPSSPDPSPGLLSTDTNTNGYASAAFQYSSRPLEPISVPVLAPVKAEDGPPVSPSPPSWVGVRSRGLTRHCAPPQASPPRLSRRDKGKWREPENSPPRSTDPTSHPPQSYSPNEQASGDHATQYEGAGNDNDHDKGKLEGEDQTERIDSLPAHPIDSPNENERTESVVSGSDTHKRADAPFAHLPLALRPVRPALAPPPALPPLPNLNASTRPSDTPRASNATQQSLSLSPRPTTRIDAPFAKVPRGLRPYRATALKTPPPLPKGYISLSPSPPRSPTSSVNSKPTPSLSQAPTHGEGGDGAKSSVEKRLLTLVSLTMWPVRAGAKPRAGVATRSQFIQAKGGVLPAGAAQLVIAQGGRDAGKEAGPRDSGSKRKRTASVSGTAAGTANRNKKTQGRTKAKLMERIGKDEDGTSGDGQMMTHGAVREALPDAESPRPAKRARLTAPHGSAKAPAKVMIRLPPRMTRASARLQETPDPRTSKAELDENGEFQFRV
ncbi:hypothetical protein EYR36_009994 [Pleurotus pulmonarius]|nr:hypothetical protein EYR36_009994 [Pleurotus pulmonarius]KAF4593470.1 hypothetical protein EYR38_009185 [Pleurotus pulmonarius]